MGLTPSTSGVPSLLVDTREAARLLNISTRTLWTLTARGELPSVRIGRRVLYRLETLREFSERQEGGQK